MSRGYRKPIRPVPCRTSSLWRGCLFASAAGWNKGWNEAGGETTQDDQTRMRGVLQGSRAGTHTIIDAGRSLAGGVSLDGINWNAPLSRYDISRGMSIAVLFRPNDLSFPSNRTVFAKRVSDALANPGWILIIQDTTVRYRFELSTGAAEDIVTSTVAPSIDRTDLVVVTYDRSNLRMYINGELDATVAATTAVTNNTLDLAILAGSTNTNAIDGNVPMAALWNRPLPPSEVVALYSDPYRMWKESHRDFMFGPGGVPSAGGIGTYFLIF